MKFENTAVFNIEGAIRGMRFPMQSNSKSDSHYCLPNECINCRYGGCQEPNKDAYHWDPCAGDVDWQPYLIGENDMNLAQRLARASSPHDKYLRQILVTVDISASLKWWKQMDQYKVGTVTNSESTMHRISANPITLECFDFTEEPRMLEEDIVNKLEILRQKYIETKNQAHWNRLVDLLPESFIQKRHWSGNYAVVKNAYYWRCVLPHKLKEWSVDFKAWAESLPYFSQLINTYKG